MEKHDARVSRRADHHDPRGPRPGRGRPAPGRGSGSREGAGRYRQPGPAVAPGRRAAQHRPVACRRRGRAAREGARHAAAAPLDDRGDHRRRVPPQRPGLGADPVIGVWATVSVYRDGMLVQVDRGGHPTINPFINTDDAKDEYNARQPADDVANYLQPWSKLLRDNGYPPDEARAAALTVLPDILRYDRAQSATYPNGRIPTDDVYSARFAWLTYGKVTSDGLKPHDDLLAEFPYLGLPNP